MIIFGKQKNGIPMIPGQTVRNVLARKEPISQKCFSQKNATSVVVCVIIASKVNTILPPSGKTSHLELEIETLGRVYKKMCSRH